MKTYDLIGLGIGPFNLSLASLSEKHDTKKFIFLEKKESFSWHPELMFEDADMQTSCFKDLVTAADPTSPYSFMNYLVANGLFYAFMNTSRMVVTRNEFEHYCKWASVKLGERLSFNHSVKSVEFKEDHFHVITDKNEFKALNLSVATGHYPRYPRFVNKSDLGPNFFHAKTGQLSNLNLANKRVVIIGGGQTGIEIFANALKGKWGMPNEVRIISKRANLTPLDESNFTNEYFTPQYVDTFFDLPAEKKKQIVGEQKFASDGNTPSHLQNLYKTLYLNTLNNIGPNFNILPMRECLDIKKDVSTYNITLKNNFADCEEHISADVVILATGFEQVIPDYLNPLREMILKDSEDRFIINKNFTLKTRLSDKNKIYALNFSRNGHGISEPQTSLMAWRSGTILNDLYNTQIYHLNNNIRSFIQYSKISN